MQETRRTRRHLLEYFVDVVGVDREFRAIQSSTRGVLDEIGLGALALDDRQRGILMANFKTETADEKSRPSCRLA